MVEIDGRQVRVTNPAKVFFSARGETKFDLVEYYLAVGEGALRGVYERPTVLKRFPNGAEGEFFYQKRAPVKGRPDWLQTVTVDFPSGRSAEELCPVDIAHLVYAVNLGCLDLNPWPVRRGDVDHPDELRIDLDPQPGTDFSDVRVAAAEVRRLLEEVGIVGYPKTTGNRGLHVYVRLEPRWDAYAVRSAAVAVARELERRRPDAITAAWWKEERGRRIFVDYNQNAPHKTVFGAWSVRARKSAQVSTPLRWEEVDEVHPDELTMATVPDRLAREGDPWKAMNAAPQSLEPLLAMHEHDRASGLLDAPWPPVYPKMPDEPSRVAPSRARKNV